MLFFLTPLESNKMRKKLFVVIFILLVSLISGIRWNTGTDWQPYNDLFTTCEAFSECMLYPHFEYGYKILMWLYQSIFDSYSMWLFLLTLVVVGSKLFTVIDRPYAGMLFLVILGFSLGDLFPVRQSLALAVGFLGLYCYSSGKFISFLSFIAVAGLVHKTAFILLLVPFVVLGDLKKVVIMAVAFGTAFYFFAFDVISTLAGYFGFEYITYQVEVYVNEYAGRIGFLSLAYKTLILVMMVKLFPRYQMRLNRFECNSVKLTAFGLVFSSIIEFNNVEFNRISIYFVCFEIVAVPALLYFFVREKIDRGEEGVALFLMVIVIIFYLIRLGGGLAMYWDLYFPYETIFNDYHKDVY